MSDGEGFARRVTLANLKSFAPLLKPKRAAGHAAGAGSEETNEQSTDAANQGLEVDPQLAAAEALFSGKSIRTGIRYSRPEGGRPGSADENAGPRQGSGLAASTESKEVLLMRARKRRGDNGTQLQISIRVHRTFMSSAAEVVSAADGISRRIDFNQARGGNNTLRFEAPEMRTMKNPVVRFTWRDNGDEAGGTDRILRYELFDADTDSEGKEILAKLEEGIGTPPSTKLNQLSREETVLSTSDREKAQWYRLE